MFQGFLFSQSLFFHIVFSTDYSTWCIQQDNTRRKGVPVCTKGVSSVECVHMHVTHLSGTCAAVRCFHRRYPGSGAKDLLVWLLSLRQKLLFAVGGSILTNTRAAEWLGFAFCLSVCHRQKLFYREDLPFILVMVFKSPRLSSISLFFLDRKAQLPCGTKGLCAYR